MSHLVAIKDAAAALGISRAALWRLSQRYEAFKPRTALGFSRRKFYPANQVFVMAAALVGDISPDAAAMAIGRALPRPERDKE